MFVSKSIIYSLFTIYFSDFLLYNVIKGCDYMPLARQELYDNVLNMVKQEDENTDVFERDSRIIKYLLENCEITLPEENRFFIMVNCRDIIGIVPGQRAKKSHAEVIRQGLEPGIAARAYTGYYDFGHTSPHWESVIELGIYGLRNRVAEYAEKYKDDAKKCRLYNYLLEIYDTAIAFMKRCAEVASDNGRHEMAASIMKLTESKPETLYEALQTSLIYYNLQQMFDGSILRTLGRLDKLFYPYFVKEDKEKGAELLYAFIKEADSYKATANIPFAIGGTDVNGNTLVNELSYLILDIYKNANTIYTKLHLLMSDTMPDDIVCKAFDCVRNGCNSIVFMSDNKIIEGLEKLGEDHADAVNYHVVGCYECGAEKELTCSCNARVNIPKALELALNGGKDMLTDKLLGLENEGVFPNFDALYNEFLRQLEHLCNSAMKITDIYESYYNILHSAPVFTATYEYCLENGKELYTEYGAKYNNSSVNALGIATAVDALSAILKLVYEDKALTLPKLMEILKSDWKDNEVLRLTIKNKFPHYGTANADVDALAGDITKNLAKYVSGKPNVKGGVYRLGLFSIDWRHDFGAKTAASADGRKSGEAISQNSTASFGADIDGATSHLLSASSIDASDTPNGHIVDIDLHSSAVKGENGLKTAVSTLRTYFSLGGFGVHYNVLDTETLKDAKAHPEKYPNLQVRLCGWNVLFSTLSEKEKDEFIVRSMRI